MDAAQTPQTPHHRPAPRNVRPCKSKRPPLPPGRWTFARKRLRFEAFTTDDAPAPPPPQPADAHLAADAHEAFSSLCLETN